MVDPFSIGEIFTLLQNFQDVVAPSWINVHNLDEQINFRPYFGWFVHTCVRIEHYSEISFCTNQNKLNDSKFFLKEKS